MKRFDTRVQDLKYKVLEKVARNAWDGNIIDGALAIPTEIMPGKNPTMRCCVYKERAILSERVKHAMGEKDRRENVIEVIDIACDDCPAGGFTVTDTCRGCIAHGCAEACPFDAISFDAEKRAYIDKSKCKNCGKCAVNCPYTAITNRKRPCEEACKIKAISESQAGHAQIDREACTSCGSCVYKCPFGAITDTSYILDAIKIIRESDGGKNYKAYAVIAPAIASQFTYASFGQVISGIKALGFNFVVEAARGADFVAHEESGELIEKGFLISSCCPAFVELVEKQFPTLKEFISHNLSPMATISKKIKEDDGGSRVVFIGPCTAKKKEIKKPEVSPYVDCAITFEELLALFDSRDIDLTQLPETKLDEASYFGRIFARCGGLAEAIQRGISERGSDFEVKSHVSDGLESCRAALLQAKAGKLDANFIEGMACVGGCIGGAGVLIHTDKNRTAIDKYGEKAKYKSISESLAVDE